MKKLKQALVKKNDGSGDMIASLLVVLALTIFMFMFVNIMGDLSTRISLDQIARKYILRMESSGQLNSAQIAEIKEECHKIYAVKQAIGDDLNQIEVIWNKGTGTAAGYGDTITLTIKCPVSVTTLRKTDIKEASDGHKENVGGSQVAYTDRSKKAIYEITKQSTAKY